MSRMEASEIGNAALLSYEVRLLLARIRGVKGRAEQHRTSNARHQTLNTEHRTSKAEFWMSGCLRMTGGNGVETNIWLLKGDELRSSSGRAMRHRGTRTTTGLCAY